MSIDVSIIIVNYNCGDYLPKCIESIYDRTESVAVEIIVVDNKSLDNSLSIIRELFPKVIIIENGQNVGFGAANNVGAKSAKGQYLLLLNPDTILENNAIKYFYDFAQTNDFQFGCCGGNLLDEQKQPANLGGNFPTLFQLFSDIGFRKFYPKFYKRKITLLMTVIDLSESNEIECICGADLFIEKTVFEKMKGFDEDYFLYYEDTDLCYRLKAAGYKNYIVKEAKILHLESVVISDNQTEKLNLKKFTFSEKSKQFFFRKSYGYLSVLTAKFLTIFYIFVRFFAHKGDFKTYLKMIVLSLKMKSN